MSITSSHGILRKSPEFGNIGNNSLKTSTKPPFSIAGRPTDGEGDKCDPEDYRMIQHLISAAIAYTTEDIVRAREVVSTSGNLATAQAVLRGLSTRTQNRIEDLKRKISNFSDCGDNDKQARRLTRHLSWLKTYKTKIDDTNKFLDQKIKATPSLQYSTNNTNNIMIPIIRILERGKDMLVQRA